LGWKDDGKTGSAHRRNILPLGRKQNAKLDSGVRRSKVEVIWHPETGDHVPRRALHFFSQTVCEPSLVTVVMKYGPATMTARDDVVKRTGKLQTRRSGHRSGSLRVKKQTNVGSSTRLKTEHQG